MERNLVSKKLEEGGEVRRGRQLDSLNEPTTRLGIPLLFVHARSKGRDLLERVSERIVSLILERRSGLEKVLELFVKQKQGINDLELEDRKRRKENSRAFDIEGFAGLEGAGRTRG